MEGTTAQKALNADLSAGAYTYTSAPTALFTGYSQPGQSTGASPEREMSAGGCSQSYADNSRSCNIACSG